MLINAVLSKKDHCIALPERVSKFALSASPKKQGKWHPYFPIISSGFGHSFLFDATDV